MAPKICHVEAGGRAGDLQRSQSVRRIGRLLVHVKNIVSEDEALQVAAGIFSFPAFLFRQADEVALQQVEVQVQTGGPLHDVLIHILAFTVCRMEAVELGHVVPAQVEVGNRDSLVAENRPILAPDGYAVVGDGHIHRDLIRRSLIVVILCVQTVGGFLDRNGKGHSDVFTVRAGRLDPRLIGAGVFFRNKQAGSGDFCLDAELRCIGQRVGQRVAVRIFKDVPQLDLQQAAGHHLTGGDGIRLYAHAGIRSQRRDDAQRACRQEQCHCQQNG